MIGFDSTSSSSTTNSSPTDPGGVLALLADIVTALLAHVCLAGLSTILVLLYVTVRPFSQQAYRRLAAQWGASSLIDAVALLLPNTRIVLTGDSDVPSSVGTSIMVSNHFMDADWWAILLMSRCIGLRGSVKVILRNEYLHVNVGSNTTTNGATSDASSSSAQAGSTTNGTTTVVATNAANGSSNNMISTAGFDSTASSSSPTAGSSTAHHSHHHYQHHQSQQPQHQGPQDLALMAKLLHLFLEFPLMNGEQDYISNRNQMFQLLRSFATDETESSSAERGSSSSHNSSSNHSTGAAAPVHLLFFPEGWCLHSSSTSDRQSILAKSNEFAQREGRPQLRHLLLPRARGFNASLECLRESTPVVYDVTMAPKGYDGSLPPAAKLSSISLWNILRRKFPKEIHIRIKKYNMEDVLQDSSWLDTKWAEKDRLLSHFARHQCFPVDGRGYRSRNRYFDSRYYSLESSTVALFRLLVLPFTVPLILLLSVPLFWTLVCIWLVNRSLRFLSGAPLDARRGDDSRHSGISSADQTPGSNPSGTPYVPATPFASPSVTSWREMLNNATASGGVSSSTTQ